MQVNLSSSALRTPGFSSQMNAADFYFQESKINLFGDIFYKKAGEKT